VLKNLKEFHYPLKVSEAVALLDRLGARGAVIAGGTTLSRLPNPTVESLVDITRLGLSYVKESKADVRVGATTPLQALAESAVLRRYAGGLVAKAAASVSTRLVRNVGTVGGDIVAAYPYNDIPVALLALDASVALVSRKGEKVVPYALMVEEHPWRFVGKRQLLTEIRLPGKLAGWGSSYQRFARSRSEWEASVIVAATAQREGGALRSARLVVGAVTRRPLRFPEAEALVVGRPFNRAAAEAAAKVVAEKLEPMSDWRSSKEHRREVTKVLVVRALNEAFEAAGK
jgi:CO/xanthine dehydrogenase FAD-binding subunit